MIPISKDSERKVLSKNDSIPLQEGDFTARFQRGKREVLYLSNCEVICLAEYFIDHHSPSDYWVLAFKIDDDHFYSAVVKNGEVISEKTSNQIETLSAHEFDILQSETVVSNFDFEYQGVQANNIGEVDLLTLPKKYITSADESKRIFRRKRFFKYCVVSIGLLALGAYVSGNKQQNKQSAPVVDIYAAYKQDIANQIDAYHALEQAVNLYAMTLTLPEPLEVAAIEKKGNSLELSFKNADVRLSVIKQWLDQYPQLKPFYTNKKIVINLSGSATHWKKLIVPVGTFPEFVHDKAIDVGGKSVSLNDVVENNHYIQRAIEARFDDKQLGVLSLYMQIFKDTPSFLSNLRLIPASGKSPLINVEFSVTVKGKQNEQK